MTASKFAFISEHGKEQYIITEDKRIKIPQHKTALIQTNESIYIDGDICGTYHSRVKLTKMGLAHIGTTLDPHYFGTSLIAVHNITDKDIEIEVGEQFVSLMFYRLSHKSPKLHDNPPGRSDLYNMQGIQDFLYIYDGDKREEYKKEVTEWANESFRTNEHELKRIVHSFVEDINCDRKLQLVNILGTILQIISAVGLIVFGLITTIPVESQSFKVYIVAIGLIPQLIGIIKGAVLKYMKAHSNLLQEET